jgi:putative FmdB family regulatory protein
MPMFDLKCKVCGHIFEAFAFPHEHIGCRVCGADTDRIWLPGHSPTVIGDEIDQVIENLGPQPKRYRSRAELKRDMDAAGVMPKVRHIGEQGSDKSKHTTRWV